MKLHEKLGIALIFFILVSFCIGAFAGIFKIYPGSTIFADSTHLNNYEHVFSHRIPYQDPTTYLLWGGISHKYDPIPDETLHLRSKMKNTTSPVFYHDLQMPLAFMTWANPYANPQVKNFNVADTTFTLSYDRAQDIFKATPLHPNPKSEVYYKLDKEQDTLYRMPQSGIHLFPQNPTNDYGGLLIVFKSGANLTSRKHTGCWGYRPNKVSTYLESVGKTETVPMLLLEEISKPCQSMTVSEKIPGDYIGGIKVPFPRRG